MAMPTFSRIRWRTTIPLVLVLLALLLAMVFPIASHLLTSAAASGGAASDGPGALSHFDLARKDCLGTARNTTSKVWFTIANGVLSDVYYPTIDNTNVETLQYIVSDGSTFTDLQIRDTTYTVQLLDTHSQALDCQVRTTAKSGKYRIITDYLTDPNQNTLVMNVDFIPLIGALSNYQLYVRYDPSINGNGGGGSGNGGGDTGTIDTSSGHTVPIAFDTVAKNNPFNRNYAVPVYSALDTSTPFTQVSNGFVGQPSDGLVQLDTSHTLTALYIQATNGNLVQTAQANISHGGMFTLALGFGSSQTSAVRASEASLATQFSQLQKGYESGWNAYDSTLIAPPTHFNGASGSQWRQLVAEYYLSANVVKASEDKTFPGAIVASLSSPWGQAVSAGDPNNLFFGSYREVFARDVYEAWTGLVLDGDLATAGYVVKFLFNKQQQADGSMPRNSLLNGLTAPDSFGTQLDEASYPIIMAQQLGMTDSNFYLKHIVPAANFVISHGPSFGSERWEEQGGYSPSTISAEIAGLVAAADIAKVNGDTKSEQLWLGVADDWQRSVEGWTVTTNGPLSKTPYFIRLSKTGDPNAAISYNVGNGGPTLDQRSVIDAGFLELVRLGELSADDADVQASLPVVDAKIKSDTASGPGWHRYNGDGYGDGETDGHPWAPSNKGTGHLWPALSAERGEQDLATYDNEGAAALLLGMSRFASGVGLIPEQDWELADLPPSPFGTDPTVASIGFRNGGPAGSAAPLTWSAASFVRLAGELGDDARHDNRRRERRLQRRRRDHGRDERAEHSRRQPERRDRARAAHHRVRLRARPAHPRRLGSGRRRQRPRHVPIPNVRQLPRGRVRHRAVPGLRRRLGRHLPPEDARPQADVRQPARRAARGHVRARPGRGADLDGSVLRRAQLHDRARLRVEPADRGAGLRPALHRREQHPEHARRREHFRERGLALHYVPRLEGVSWDAGARLGPHGRAHRPGRLQLRPGARLPVDAAGVPVRRLRARRHRADLRRRPEHGAEGARRDHAARRRSFDRARSDGRTGCAAGRYDPLAARSRATTRALIRPGPERSAQGARRPVVAHPNHAQRSAPRLWRSTHGSSPRTVLVDRDA